MRRSITLALGAAAVATLAAGCASSGGTTAASSSSPTAANSAVSSPAPATSGAPAAGGATALKVANSADGQILVDGNGKALYLFMADTGTTSTCNGACATAWPPDLTTGMPTGAGLTAPIATTTRTDKSTQVTYNGHPLYTFVMDAKPGDINGQGKNAFGGLWYLVSPSGAAITTTSAPTSAPAAGVGGY